MSHPVIDLALDLIRIPSPSGEEHGVLSYLEQLAEDRGFVVTKIPVENPRYRAGRYDLLIAPEHRETPIVLTTHVDVVPGGPEPRVSEERLYGRGACDTKGIAAAMFCALGELCVAGHRDTSLLFVVGEETDSDGAKAAAAALTPRSFIINGEPTENRFVRVQRGLCMVELSCSGVSCHSGYPEEGHSAVHDLIAVLADILNEPWPGDPNVGETLVNVGKIAGGKAANVLADAASAVIMVRVATDVVSILERIGQIIAGRATIRVLTASDPQYLHVPAGAPECNVGYGSDVAHLRPLGVPLMYGPGSILQAHTDDEWVMVHELIAAVGVYRDICAGLVG
jgi:acetylornithine deacetylase